MWTNSRDNFNKRASYVYNFANMVFEDCLFEEGYQWQQGIRGVDDGAMRNGVTHDIGRGFRAWNGVAGSMFFRCKDWVFEDCEWGFIEIGLGSGAVENGKPAGIEYVHHQTRLVLEYMRNLRDRATAKAEGCELGKTP